MLNLDDGINLGSGLGGGSHTTVSNNTIRGNGLNGIDACSIRGNPCITTDDVIVGNLVQANGFGDPLNSEQSDTGDGIHIVSITPPGRSFSDFFPPTRLGSSSPPTPSSITPVTASWSGRRTTRS